jgi:asparagine synthase (glutamine-hydrolysing)
MFAVIATRASRAAPGDLACGDALLAALFPFVQPDVAGVWCSERALIAHGVIHNTPESLHERAPEVCAETGRVIASWVRLDNRAALCAQLGLAQRPELTDPQIILAAHRQWGAECADRLEGDFSFVIHDPATGECYCARDALGAKPFYFVLTDEVFIAATSIAAIRAVASLHLTPSHAWIALFAAAMNFADDRGAYEQVRKLPPAHHLRVARSGQGEPQRYFDWDLAAPHSTRREAHWVEAYREAFDRAVAARARSRFLVASDSSGGLDSASIVGSVIDALPHDRADFHVFAMIGMEQEPELVEAVSVMCGVQHTHRLFKPETLRIDASFERALKALGHPPEHGQLLLHPQFFEICREHGIRTVLSGYGGDEVVTGYANHLIDELHARRAFGAVFAEMPGSLPHRAGRLVKRMWRGPDDPDVRARRVMEAKLATACLNHAFLEDTGLGKQIEAWFLPARGDLTLNTIAAFDPGFRRGRAGRLEASAVYSATYGVEYRFPMFDRALMQQYFATPSIEKRHRDIGRHLHRRAMEGRIPPRIQWQKSKYLGRFIDGRPVQEDPPEMHFDALAGELQAIIDRKAFEQSLLQQRADSGALTEADLRRRYFLWLIRQLSVWLERR